MLRYLHVYLRVFMYFRYAYRFSPFVIIPLSLLLLHLEKKERDVFHSVEGGTHVYI